MTPNYGTASADGADNAQLDLSATETEKARLSRKTFMWFPVLGMSLLGIMVATLLVTKRKTMDQYFTSNAIQSEASLDIQNPTAAKPNFIFIVADDMAYNSIGYEPYDLANHTTPFLTKLSAQGIRNINYYGQEVCTPSRAAFLTGRYPIHTGMQFQEVGDADSWGLNLTEILLPAILRENGYKTAALGKWHLGHYSPRYLPTARGFDLFMGYMTGETFMWSKRVPGYDHFHDCLYMDESCYFGYNGTDRGTYSTFLYRDKAIDLIRLHDYSENGPLFLYLAFQAPHDPFEDIHNFEDGIPPDYLDDTTWDYIHTHVVGRKRRQYAMALRLVDDSVSAIYEALDDVGQLNNTYIIFVSDNGGCASAGGRTGPLRGDKGSLWEGGVKVDSFIYSPLIPESLQGTNYSGIMHVTDWFPTILDLAGIEYTARTGYALDGVSQKDPWLKGESHNKREYLLYNFYYNVNDYLFTEYSNAPLAIRNQKYKLVHAFVDNPTSDWYNYDEALDDDSSLAECGTCDQIEALGGNYSYFLFDLESDPYETTNLYYTSDDDAQDVMTDLYDQIAYYKETAARCYGIQSSKPEATVKWQTHDNYVSPWINEDSLGDVNSYPSYCVSAGIFAPTQKNIDDITPPLYDDDTDTDDDSAENDWQDDDDDDYTTPTRRRRRL